MNRVIDNIVINNIIINSKIKTDACSKKNGAVSPRNYERCVIWQAAYHEKKYRSQNNCLLQKKRTAKSRVRGRPSTTDSPSIQRQKQG